jgi:phage terminase large subunit GpA-like protein
MNPLIEVFCQNMEPPSELHPADWCAEHVYVENSERSAKFDPSQVRWWRKVMGCFADYETKHMVFIGPTGCGKSTFYEGIACWIVAQSPGSTLYASQTDSDAQLWAETRLMKSLFRCKPVDHLWPSNMRNSIRRDSLVFPHMFMTIGGANKSNFQERSITYGLGDEAWAWKRGMVREWLGRHHNRENRKFILASQAGEIASEDGIGETSELHLEHEKCRKWEFAWKCPECSQVQPFRFEQMRWDAVIKEDGKPDDQASADTCRRVCEGCQAEFADTASNRRMLYDSYQENDGYLLVNPDGLRGYEGFHLDAGAIFWISWADDVLQKIAADRQMAIGDHTQLKQWTQKRRALGWSDAVTAKVIELRPSGYTSGDYEEARKIDDEVVRFMTVDAGGDHYWSTIRAWAAGGASRLLWFGYVASESELINLQKKYSVESRCCFLDVGFEQERMADLIARNGWRGIKGDGSRKMGWDWEIKTGPKKGEKEIRLYSHKWFAKAKSGARAECWHVATEPLQYILQRLIDGEGAEWLAYDDAPPTYRKHLNGEFLGVEKDARGREVQKWKRRGANHGRDCEIYSLAAALMFKVFAATPDDLTSEA